MKEESNCNKKIINIDRTTSGNVQFTNKPSALSAFLNLLGNFTFFYGGFGNFDAFSTDIKFKYFFILPHF